MGVSGRRRRAAQSAEKDAALATPHDTATQAPCSAAEEQLARWLAAMERLRLAEYVRYAENHRRVFLSHFVGGLARGVGMAVGFTILGAVLVLFLQDLASRNLPVIGDFIARIVSVVQNRLE